MCLDKLGYDSKIYAGHSFRSGVATTAAELNIDDSVIKMMGLWGELGLPSVPHTSADIGRSVKKIGPK